MTQTAPAPTAPAPIATVTEIPPAADSGEAQLTKEVGVLWQVHAQAQSSLTKSREELKAIRVDLSLRLYDLKTVLSKPGRGGAWSSFLAARKIPRSTADRMVLAHQKTLAPPAVNCASEHISESAETTIHRYLHAMWPKLSRILTTPESVELFIGGLRHRTDKSFNTTSQAPSGS